MTPIEVYRGTGDRAGQPINVPILSSDMLLVRGRAEMDANAHSAVEHDVQILFRQGLRLGQLAALPDPSTAQQVRGKVTGVSISVSISRGDNPELHISTHVRIRQPV